MKLRMLKTTKGSEDGVTIKTFLEGGVYDIEPDLANVFQNQMFVAEPEIKPVIETPEDNMQFEKPKVSYKTVTLKDKPKKWIGLQIRPLGGNGVLTVTGIGKGGAVILGNGKEIHYSAIRKGWVIH